MKRGMKVTKCCQNVLKGVVHFYIITAINKCTFLTKSPHFRAKGNAFKIDWKGKYCKIIQGNTLEPHVKNQCFGSLIIPFSAF